MNLKFVLIDGMLYYLLIKISTSQPRSADHVLIFVLLDDIKKIMDSLRKKFTKISIMCTVATSLTPFYIYIYIIRRIWVQKIGYVGSRLYGRINCTYFNSELGIVYG